MTGYMQAPPTKTAARPKSVVHSYIVLCLWAGISMSYYIAGAMALREEWFHGMRHARDPFAFGQDGQTLTHLEREAKDAGLQVGDVLLSINGKVFTGYFEEHGHLGLAIGDVSGKGISAALLMACEHLCGA
jgi:hypothetical protein